MATSLTNEQEQELFLFTKQKEIEAETQVRIMTEAQRISKGGLTDLDYEEAVTRIRCEVQDEFAEKQAARDARRDNMQLAIAVIGAAGGLLTAGATVYSAIKTSNAQTEAARIGAEKHYLHTHVNTDGTTIVKF